MSTEKQKVFVLDTNILLADPHCFYKFENNNIVIPLTVIEEMDNFKKDMTETGRNARLVSRQLDEFRKCGSLFKGVNLVNELGEIGGTIRVVTAKKEHIELLPSALDKRKADSHILAVALSIEDSVFVTRDTNLRIIADALQQPTEDYRSDIVVKGELYSGHAVGVVTQDVINRLFAGEVLEDVLIEVVEGEISENVYFNLNGVCLARLSGNKLKAIKNQHERGYWGIIPKNMCQHFAVDALLDDDIKMVTICGQAGTGKTLLALALGLFQVETNTYKKVLAARPVFPMGKDIGFLPGTKEEKLDPWMQPIYDNAELLLNIKDADGKRKRGHEELVEFGLLEIEALTYVRGRSIPKQFIIIDEAQNLTPHEIKTIVTRAGEGTKIILTGDPEQIDVPFLDYSNNGLSYAVEKFKDQPIAAHITLDKGERSELATLAAKIL